MNFIPKWRKGKKPPVQLDDCDYDSDRKRKGKKPPVQLDDCDYDSDRKRNRRNLMALLGGVAGFGIASKASAQQPSTLTNMPYASTPLSGAELTYVVQSGVSKKTPVSSISGSGGGTPGGTNGQLQFNNSGLFGGLGVGSGLSVVGGNLTATGGGSGGITVVTSIAAMQALTGAAGAVAYLDAGGRSGTFAWSTANHATDINNDPGQGEWIAAPGNFIVTGTIVPNLVGTYVPSGLTYNGAPYWVCAGVGYIWWYSTGSFWSINPTLGSLTGNGPSSFGLGGNNIFAPSSGTYGPGGSSTGSATVVGTAGAAGAWQRQWNGTCDWAWWGAIADTVCVVDPITWVSTNPGTGTNTDNGVAFLNWQVWAQYKSSLGLGVYVEPSYGVTGVYGWLLSTTSYYWVAGISKLHINGRKIISMQQLQTGQASTSQFPVINSVGLVPSNIVLIQTTVSSAVAFTCVTSTDANKFTVNVWCVLTSIDTQRGGFPPNPQNYQYVQVSSSTIYASVAISSGTYNSGSGALALTLASATFGVTPPAVLVGQWITISSLTGTGAFASLDGSWQITSITGSGLVVNASATAGLGAATITGGTLAATGVVTVGEPIENAHLSTNPDYTTTPTWACGAARATVLPGWDCEHIYEGLQVNTSFSANSPNGNYVTLGAAKSIVTIDWVGTGASETLSSNIVHIRPKFKTTGETDKQVETITWTDPDCPMVSISLQSACPKNLNITGGRIYGIVGCSQKLSVRGTELLQYADLGMTYGCNYSVSFDGCRIYNATSASGIFDLANQITIDGSTISYANGTFTVALATISFNINQASLVPGMVIMLEAVASDTAVINMTADYGALLVMGVRQQNPVPAATTSSTPNTVVSTGSVTFTVPSGLTIPTGQPLIAQASGGGMAGTVTSYSGTTLVMNVTNSSGSGTGLTPWVITFSVGWLYIDTNGPTALPGWCSNARANIVRVGTVEYKNCTGNGFIRSYSDAAARGKNLLEWYRQIIVGTTAYPYAASVNTQIQGVLTSVEVNVSVVHPTSNATLGITIFTYVVTQGPGGAVTADPSGYTGISIDLTTLGKRVITPTSFVGKQPNDNVAVGGVTSPTLPLNRLTFLLEYVITAPASTSPMIELIVETDTGLVKSLATQ